MNHLTVYTIERLVRIDDCELLTIDGVRRSLHECVEVIQTFFKGKPKPTIKITSPSTNGDVVLLAHTKVSLPMLSTDITLFVRQWKL